MQTSTLLTPVSVTATGGGSDLDISAFTGRLRFNRTTLNTAGTSPTLADKLQHSDALTRGLEQSTVGATDNNIKTSSSVNTLVGLKFTQSGAKQVKRVAFQLKKIGTLTAGKKLTLAIQTDSAGAPSGTAATNGTSNTVDIDTEVGTSYAWVVFTFAKPVDLADATVYHFVLSADYTASGSNAVNVRSLTAASGGTLETKDATTWTLTTTQKVEVYVDQYDFSDITGGAFTARDTAGTAAIDSLEFNADDLKAIVRLYSTIGGTSNPAWTSAATAVGNPVNA